MRGEFELIDLLRERIAALGGGEAPGLRVGSGDDAAVAESAGATATSVDALVDGVHFRRSNFPPVAIGRKAMAAALSDLAAMGAVPGEAYVQLGLPDDLSEAELVEIADGLAAVAARDAIAVAGGDVVASPVLFLALTVVGREVEGARLVTRAGAEPGDALLVTGALGGAAAGLALLDEPALAAALEPGLADSLRARQLDPQPRLAAGLALARSGARALIDLSDGLAGDARHLAGASSVRIEVDLGSVPVQPGVPEVAVAAGREPLRLVVAGGEDYELLAAVPAERLDAALEAVRDQGLDPAVVGRVETGEGVVLRGPNGRELDVRGFDQIRSRARAEPI